MPERSEEIGALWISNKREGMMTGKVNGVSIVAFKNTNKKNPNMPDWRILLARNQTPQTAKPAQKPAPADDFGSEDGAPF